MSKYDKLKQKNTVQRAAEKPKLELAVRASKEMVQDARRTAEVYRNAGEILDDIDARFEEATGLNGTDITFLMLATALQIGRWVIIGAIRTTIDTQIDNATQINPDTGRVAHDDPKIKSKEKEQRQEFLKKHDADEVVQSEKHRDWKQIITDGVPYDVTKGCLRGTGGPYHRMYTLGHDPVLGWIFGPINILSDSITLKDFMTFDVYMGPRRKHWIHPPTTLSKALGSSISSVCEDSVRLPAAIAKQSMHFASDYYTKCGLSLPLISTFSPDYAGKLYKKGYDTLKFLTENKEALKAANAFAAIGAQTIIAVLINMMISLIHGLFYDPNKHISRDLYEVKTRKILSISNAIASTSNLIWVGANAYIGNENAWKYLDIGGIAVTMHRLISDTQFIRQVKSEFLEKEWQNAVLGEEYSFLEEAKKYES